LHPTSRIDKSTHLLGLLGPILQTISASTTRTASSGRVCPCERPCPPLDTGKDGTRQDVSNALLNALENSDVPECHYGATKLRQLFLTPQEVRQSARAAGALRCVCMSIESAGERLHLTGEMVIYFVC
jgi:hypothetical protein